MKLYTYDGSYKGGIAILAPSREEASRILAEAKIPMYYGNDRGDTWIVEPSEWRESEANKPILFMGDR